MEARRFSHIWNEILKTFREEDLISYRFVLCCCLVLSLVHESSVSVLLFAFL